MFLTKSGLFLHFCNHKPFDSPFHTLLRIPVKDEQDRRLDVLRFPFVFILTFFIRSDLIAHSTQHVRRGLGGEDEGFEHGGGDLAQDAAHSSHCPLVFMFLLGHHPNGRCSAFHTLNIKQIQQFVMKYFSPII